MPVESKVKFQDRALGMFRVGNVPVFLPVVLSIMVLVSVLVSVPVVWANKTILDSNNFVRVLGDVLEDPRLRKDVSAAGTNYFMSEVEAITENIPLGFGDIVRRSLQVTVDESMAHAVESGEFQNAWRSALGVTHQGLIDSLNDGSVSEGDAGVAVVLTPLVDFLADSVYRQLLGTSAKDNGFVADVGSIHVGDSSIIGLFKVFKNFDFIAVLFLIAAGLMMVAAVVLSRRRGVTILFLGGGMLAVTAIWYGVSLFFQDNVIQNSRADGLVSVFTSEIIDRFVADFHAWVLWVALAGCILIISGLAFGLVRRLETGVKNTDALE